MGAILHPLGKATNIIILFSGEFLPESISYRVNEFCSIMTTIQRLPKRNETTTQTKSLSFILKTLCEWDTWIPPVTVILAALSGSVKLGPFLFQAVTISSCVEQQSSLSKQLLRVTFIVVHLPAMVLLIGLTARYHTVNMITSAPPLSSGSSHVTTKRVWLILTSVKWSCGIAGRPKN